MHTMAFFNNCSNWHEQNYTCIFNGLGNCRDQISQFICNSHAKIFGLIYKRFSYTDGDNYHRSGVNTYVYTNTKLNIPLFLDGKAQIMSNDINTFADNVWQNYFNNMSGGEAKQKFKDMIACNVGINALQTRCKLGNWMDDPTSYIQALSSNDTYQIMYTQSLPMLHKMLFFYIPPHITKHEPSPQHSTSSETIFINNLTLCYDPYTNGYNFINPIGKLILKWTDHPDCVATRLVITGGRIVSSTHDTVTFKTVTNNH